MDEKDAKIEALELIIAELKRRLGMNAGNNGKSPGSDELAKKPAWQPKSLRESSKNPSGGRKGSKSTTLRQVAKPDFVVEHAPEACEHCAEPLHSSPVISVNKRQALNHCAADLASERTEVLQTLQKAAVKNVDETGLRIAGKTSWLHVLCNDALTYYRVDAKRGAICREVSGIVVHDHFKPYFTMQNVKQGLCNAHHLRELRAVAEFGSHEKGVWARGMARLLLVVCRLVKKMQSMPRSSKNLFIRKVLRVYRRIIGKGEAMYDRPPKLPGHNLLLRLKRWRTATLRCLNGVTPSTNNQAEQDIRMMKVRQKISGGFRTFAGAEAFCVVRGFTA